MSSLVEAVRKAVTPRSRWEPEELVETVFWLRQLFAIAYGLIMGYGGVTGTAGMASYVLFSVWASVVYCSTFQGVDVDLMFASKGVVASAGLAISFGVFLLTWITVHSSSEAF